MIRADKAVSFNKIKKSSRPNGVSWLDRQEGLRCRAAVIFSRWNATWLLCAPPAEGSARVKKSGLSGSPVASSTYVVQFSVGRHADGSFPEPLAVSQEFAPTLSW